MKPPLPLPFIFWMFIVFVNKTSAQPFESDYLPLINSYFNGQREVSVISGRVDILTDEYAIEVEIDNHWKQSIGQSLWYALQTNRKAGIVLI